MFYEEAVRPILAAEFPALVHSAALIGYGSEVLRYDSPRSTDHEWGPRLLLFLRPEDHGRDATRITEALRRGLPPVFRGYSTHFGEPDEEGVRLPERKDTGPVNHKVEVHTTREFFIRWMGLDPCQEISASGWLALPQQKLLEVTAGRVFHDGLGELESVREKLAYYPRDVWLYLLASGWRRIAQVEAFVGRAGEVGDELGLALIAAGVVRDLMRLCFLMERRYAPYSKWFGTAFARLECASRLAPVFESALRARDWKERERQLSVAYALVAGMHNKLGITPPLDETVSPYHNRPFMVIHADRFVSEIEAAITDHEVRAMGARFGSVDTLTDSTDILGYPEVYTKLRPLWQTR